MPTTPGSSPERHRRSASLSTPGRSPDDGKQIPSIFTGRLKSPARLRMNSVDSVGTLSKRARACSASTEPSGNERDPISPGAVDRVFPMKSFISMDPTPTLSQSGTADRRDGYFSSVVRDTTHREASLRRTNSATGVSTPVEGAPSEAFKDSRSDRSMSQDVDSVPRAPTGSNDRFSVGGGGTGYTIASDAASARSAGSGILTDRAANFGKASGKASSVTSARTGKEAAEPDGLLTARFKHVVTEGGHAIITGRDGETLQRCEDEPIHIPGAVQPFGLLIALREESEGKLVVRVVSENSKRLIGFTPRQLFDLNSFTDILSEEQAENLLDHIDFIRDEGTDVEQNGPEVFTISIRGFQRRSRKLWCAIHTNHANPDLILCEFELEDDPDNPLTAPNDRTPEPPEDTLASKPTEQELRDSTETQSRPLRVLRSARKRKGEAAAMEVFNIMSQVQEQLAEAPSLAIFLNILVGIVKELTGFHRVMIYQFDQQWNGKVVTELVDPRATTDLYKGLHFPASDIPKQARDLYRINRVRLLYDRDQETSRLVCRDIEDLESPLDLTHAYLRAMSPIHIKYLANMAVRSSMSISLNAFNELWGLISCHTYGSHGTRVSFPIRKMCRLVSDFASRNIERLSYASRLQARKLINTAPTNKNPSGYIIASSDDLLKLFDSDFGLLSIHGETKILGKLEATQEALAMLEYFRMRSFTSVFTSTDIREEFPDLRYPPGFKTLAGILLVPLSSAGSDFIVFFRKGVLKEVKWAGNPYEKYIKEGTEGYLEPRKSFKTWSERVVGKCREWTEEEVETAAVLCLVYGKFIEVWRQKEAALENSHLTKLLLANSAHEVRTPLNAIINYLEIALEGSLDQETRDNLAKSHSASKSLVYVINDLLDLTKTEAGVELIRDESIDFLATFKEAVDVFQGEASKKGIEFNVIQHTHLPQYVLGDQRRIRQAISNVVANAVEATSEGGITVEVSVVEREEQMANIEVVVEDTGTGISPERMDLLFAQLEQVQAETASGIIEETLAPSSPKMLEKQPKQALGLGLAVVARVINNMHGQLRLKSEEGKGSRFVIVFPFDLPQADDDSRLIGTCEDPHSPVAEGAAQDAFKMVDEMTLIGATATPNPRGSMQAAGVSSRQMSRQTSSNSLHSARSVRSGRSISSQQSGRSDVDRLIEAMQEPHMVEGPSGERPSTSSRKHRSGSRRVSWNMPRTIPADRDSATPETSAVQQSVGKDFEIHPTPSTSGQRSVVDSNQPIRPVKIPDTFDIPIDGAESPALAPSQGIVGEISADELNESQNSLSTEHMQILVAEDDPINSKIVQKRMQKLGHEIQLTVNGDECASAYGAQPGRYDAVLMDMQMPIVDGLTATKMIRSFEKSHPTNMISKRASLNGRVPIIAVSATLAEKDREQYIEAGFDAWILKPINFGRLQELIECIVRHDIRSKCLYKPGQWEQGGWFQQAQPDIFAASTAPSGKQPYASEGKQVAARDEERIREYKSGDEGGKECNC